MKGFNFKEKAKLTLSFRKCNFYQWNDILELIEKEKQYRRKLALKEQKRLQKGVK